MSYPKDKDERDYCVLETIRRGIALQVRTMRQERGWTPEELARRTRLKPSTIEKIESGNYLMGKLSLYKRLAAVFDVALIAGFRPWSEAMTEEFVFNVASFDDDIALEDEASERDHADA